MSLTCHWSSKFLEIIIPPSSAAGTWAPTIFVAATEIKLSYRKVISAVLSVLFCHLKRLTLAFIHQYFLIFMTFTNFCLENCRTRSHRITLYCDNYYEIAVLAFRFRVSTSVLFLDLKFKYCQRSNQWQLPLLYHSSVSETVTLIILYSININERKLIKWLETSRFLQTTVCQSND